LGILISMVVCLQYNYRDNFIIWLGLVLGNGALHC
jgi:hypothetical protein